MKEFDEKQLRFKTGDQKVEIIASYIEALEAENRTLEEALRQIRARAQKMSPVDNIWLQGVIDMVLDD